MHRHSKISHVVEVPSLHQISTTTDAGVVTPPHLPNVEQTGQQLNIQLCDLSSTGTFCDRKKTTKPDLPHYKCIDAF